MTRLYILPKPACVNHLDYLENKLYENNFKISEIYKVSDWENISRKIYQPQLENESFKKGFESHSWLIKHLFGNKSVVLTLEKKTTKNLETKLKQLLKIKQVFRKELYGTAEGGLIICLDSKKVPIKKDNKNHKQGILGVKTSNTFYEFPNFNGCWDYYYFKYIHSPDPKIEFLVREWKILKNMNIISPQNLISKKDWLIMKYLKTFIPPSDFEKQSKSNPIKKIKKI